MQLSELQTEVRNAAGFDVSDPQATNAVLNPIINRAIRVMNGMRDWDWRIASETIATVVGQAGYPRDARAVRTVRVQDVDSGNGLIMTTAEAATRYSKYNGRPTFWYVEGGTLVMYPKPDSVRDIKHVYLQNEEELVISTDTPLIPDDAIDAAVLLAATFLLARSDDTSQLRLVEAQYNKAIRMVEQNARRAKGAPVIKTRRDWSV